MQMKKQLPLVIVFVSCLLVVVVKFFNFGPGGEAFIKRADKWNVTTSVFAFLLGPINLVRLHLNNVRRRREKWIYSAITLATIVIFTILFGYYGSNHAVTMWVINNIAYQISGAIYALLGFYICSAAYRTFKLKNLDASILLVSAVLLMLGQAPIGDAIIPGTSRLANWILTVPNSAAMRGIRLGAGVGAYAATMRVVLGLERSWTGGGTSS